jgi:hypothetical protein
MVLQTGSLEAVRCLRKERVLLVVLQTDSASVLKLKVVRKLLLKAAQTLLMVLQTDLVSVPMLKAGQMLRLLHALLELQMLLAPQTDSASAPKLKPGQNLLLKAAQMVQTVLQMDSAFVLKLETDRMPLLALGQKRLPAMVLQRPALQLADLVY